MIIRIEQYKENPSSNVYKETYKVKIGDMLLQTFSGTEVCAVGNQDGARYKARVNAEIFARDLADAIESQNCIDNPPMYAIEIHMVSMKRVDVPTWKPEGNGVTHVARQPRFVQVEVTLR